MVLRPAVAFILISIITALCMGACTPAEQAKPAEQAEQVDTADKTAFISVDGQHFIINGEPYRFVGTNLWYGAYIGADAGFGDRERLLEELDFLKANGVTNLRILGASEKSPLRDALSISFRDRSNNYNEDLLRGLDFLLSEMRARDMRAVIYLSNFWEWSGGMATYLYWVNGGEIVDPTDPEKPWPAFAEFTAGFYNNAAAQALFQDYIRALITRKNTITGQAYKDDPTIMSWQLANEPRPGYANEAGFARLPAYFNWIDTTAKFIKTLDTNHLVSIGSEGRTGCLKSDACFRDAHALDSVDYMTFHMWPKNWGWIDPSDMDATFPNTLEKAEAYITDHVQMATELNKPIVMEEFGLQRDNGAYTPGTPVTFRDRFYDLVFTKVEHNTLLNGPFAGTNFWTWGGSGRAQHEDYIWQSDDVSFVGDPPQEPQGLNSVFNNDTSTIRIIKNHAKTIQGQNTDD